MDKESEMNIIIQKQDLKAICNKVEAKIKETTENFSISLLIQMLLLWHCGDVGRNTWQCFVS